LLTAANYGATLKLPLLIIWILILRENPISIFAQMLCLNGPPNICAFIKEINKDRSGLLVHGGGMSLAFSYYLVSLRWQYFSPRILVPRTPRYPQTSRVPSNIEHELQAKAAQPLRMQGV
jgi:hypothetical protein